MKKKIKEKGWKENLESVKFRDSKSPQLIKRPKQRMILQRSPPVDANHRLQLSLPNSLSFYIQREIFIWDFLQIDGIIFNHIPPWKREANKKKKKLQNHEYLCLHFHEILKADVMAVGSERGREERHENISSVAER